MKKLWLTANMPQFLAYLAIFLFLNLSSTASAQVTPQLLSTRDCVTYLVRFGYVDRADLPDAWLPEYLNSSSSSVPNSLPNGIALPPALRTGIFAFQDYSGLRQTGIFDFDTQYQMLKPRCGNSDRHRGTQLMNVKYATMGSKWKKDPVTYRITKYSEAGMSPRDVDRIIEYSFEHWSNVTNLRFVKAPSGKVDMEIFFARRNHGDNHPFDGRNNVLAHAFGPSTGSVGDIGGDTHFDDDEPWGKDNRPQRPNEQTSLLQTAVHEIGHALGLSHSKVKDAIMYAFMDMGRSNSRFFLHSDDIQGIQYLYGKKRPNEPQSPPPAVPKPPAPTKPPAGTTTFKPSGSGGAPNLCKDSKIDAIAALHDGSIYAFKGAYSYKLDQLSSGIAKNGVTKIQNVFPGLPSNIDAAVLSPNSKRTYFFKGDKYWRYNGTKPDGGPMSMSEGFPGIPKNVDAAFVWSGDNQLYFFKGNQYWMYKPGATPAVDPKYPLSISGWNGLPDNMDAAFYSPYGSTFFFKNDQYWRYDDKKMAIAQSKPPYPRSSKLMWFGCFKYRPELEDLRSGPIQ